MIKDVRGLYMEKTVEIDTWTMNESLVGMSDQQIKVQIITCM
jgi:hypothetical protein